VSSLTSIGDLRNRLRSLGAKPAHERLLLDRWLCGTALCSGDEKPDQRFPRVLREALPVLDEELRLIARVRSEHPAPDGTARLLVELGDGRTVESVLLPREAVCVSTQVGCAVGCVFCRTGLDPFERQLGSVEIAAQAALARARRPIRKVVLMGMGEPSRNLESALEAIDLLGTEGGFGHKQLVFSTVGDRRVFERLPLGRVKPALAISLHSTDPEKRARLLPRAQPITPAELVELADAYSRQTGYPILYQWTLLEGINDGPEEIEGLAGLLAGRYAMLNLIPYNPSPELPFRPVEPEQTRAFATALSGRGVVTRARRPVGQAVEGGCGQLRSRP
jgi:23S rRNA (adenine2503-C2)-methyltransferase